MSEINHNSSRNHAATEAVLDSILTDLAALRTAIGAGFEASTVLDLGSLADGVGTTNTITVSGAALGDYALVSFGVDLVGFTVSAYVSAADTVGFRVQNESGSTVDLASTTVRARVMSKTAIAALTTTT